MESSATPTSNGDWIHSSRGRKELLLIGTFVLLNLLIPLLIVDLYPFSRAPMFEDAPQCYCDYHLYGPEGRDLGEEGLLAFGLHRNYWGNPIGAGVGFIPPPTVDTFGTVASQDKVTAHLEQKLRTRPELAYVEVVQEIIGDVDGHQVGTIEARTQRWRVANPVYQPEEKP
jgi:hypothetical protein